MSNETIADILAIIRGYLAIPAFWCLKCGGFVV